MSFRESHQHWEWRLQSSPEALWPMVANTNRFDKDAGLPQIEVKARAGEGASIPMSRVRARVAGMSLEWDERPFEWVRPQRFGVLRTYHSGPIEWMKVLVELKPTEKGGTQLSYHVWSQPRNLLGAILIPVQAGLFLRKRFGDTFRRYDQTLLRRKVAPPPVLPVRFSPGGPARLEAARLKLSGQALGRDLIDRLAEIVQTADDLTLARLRPYAWADHWQVSRRETLELFLRATRAGLLNLQWDLLCPMCRGAQQSSRTLSDVQQQVHCESCNIDFSANFDQSVELTFAPNPAIRHVDAHQYCLGSPEATPHIVVQQVLAAHAESAVTPLLEPGRYRVRTSTLPGGQLFLATTTSTASATLSAIATGWTNAEPVVSTAPTLLLRNETDRQQLFIIERVAWSDQAATAAEVTALQLFRDLFSSEALRPGEQFSVGNMAVVFTDLRDSTQLYQHIGDAPAFGRVMKHFDVLREAVAAEEGAVVKTIGDAVMAVFRRPIAALNAVLKTQKALRDANQGEHRLTLKAGIHLGPCIAVTLNDRLDYFGSTVNLAARLPRFSAGDDVVISEAMHSDPEIEELLSASSVLRAELFAAELKGFNTKSFDLWRVKSVG